MCIICVVCRVLCVVRVMNLKKKGGVCVISVVVCLVSGGVEVQQCRHRLLLFSLVALARGREADKEA